MNSIKYLLILHVIIFSIASCTQNKKKEEVVKEKTKKPNIVLLLSDDQAWNDY